MLDSLPILRSYTSSRGQKPNPIKILTKYAPILAWVICSTSISNVIVGFVHSDHRCSHVPPAPEQVHHIWLNEANFSATEEGSEFITDLKEPDRTHGRQSKARRHIESSLTDNGSIQDSLLGFFRRFERPKQPDLVPMKIQVYYDSSVYALDKSKFLLISEKVIPTVVNFFEELLSIRREYTIDKFRISRRCPNNTIYYAKDSVGYSRPYCMERCESHAICGEMVVPQEHLLACSYCNLTSRRCLTDFSSEGKGVANTQLLLYVSAKQTNRCKKDQTIAYAAHCAQDTKTDRPVAGHANLCPSSISIEPKDLKSLIATVKHELTHVLGFSVSLFAYYRDEQGNPLTERESVPGPIPIDQNSGYAKWSDKIIKKIIRKDWLTGLGLVDKEIHMMVTPTVVREVRRHFNCSTLEGVELEDQGSDGTSMTHLEKRLFENEAMTGTHTQASVYSRITLAVLQDTGWYVANFSKAEKLEWGRDLGCDFATKSCKSWINERRAKQMSIRPFCGRVKGDMLQISCTEDRGSKAVCNMRHFKEPLPPIYQNFDDLPGVDERSLPHYGGSVDLADYCPFIQEFTWQAQNISVRGSRCDLTVNSDESDKNAALEHYGSDSRCFEHGHRWDQRSCLYKRHWHHYGAGCYKYACSDGHANILVGNHTYQCYYTDQLIHIEQIVDDWLYNGTLVCPPCDRVCPASECTNYDKRHIDRILVFAEDGSSTNRSEASHDILDAILDETLNLIESDFSFKAGPKFQSASQVGVNETTGTDHSYYRESLLNIFRNHQKPPRQLLLCSSAISLITHQYLSILITLASTVITIRTQ